MNRGNYLEILNLVAHHDPVINERLKWSKTCKIYFSRNTKFSYTHNGCNGAGVYVFICMQGRCIFNPSR